MPGVSSSRRATETDHFRVLDCSRNELEARRFQQSAGHARGTDHFRTYRMNCSSPGGGSCPAIPAVGRQRKVIAYASYKFQ